MKIIPRSENNFNEKKNFCAIFLLVQLVGHMACCYTLRNQTNVYKYTMEGQNVETREEIIAWIVEQLRALPLGYLYQVRGFVRGFLK